MPPACEPGRADCRRGRSGNRTGGMGHFHGTPKCCLKVKGALLATEFRVKTVYMLVGPLARVSQGAQDSISRATEGQTQAGVLLTGMVCKAAPPPRGRPGRRGRRTSCQSACSTQPGPVREGHGVCERSPSLQTKPSPTLCQCSRAPTHQPRTRPGFCPAAGRPGLLGPPPGST